jgi:predicted small secreted protein
MKMMKRIMLLASFAMAALLLTAANANAGAGQTKLPINGAIINPCNGETFTFTGSFHGVFNVTIDDAGGFHLVMNDNIHVSGTGDQGSSYEGGETDQYILNGRVGVEQTIVTSFTMISKGSAPNFYQHILIHFTVNADGTLTANISTVTASCRA